VSVHARSQRRPLELRQADPALPTQHYRLRPMHHRLTDVRPHRIFRRGLGWMSRYSPLDVRLRRVPGQFLGVVVLQEADHGVAVERGSRVPGRGKCNYGMLLVAESTSRAARRHQAGGIGLRGNISAVYLSENPVHHQRTKHVELDIHVVREKVALGQLRVLQVSSAHQFADIMTKGLPAALFNDFRTSLCIRSTDAQTEGGCRRPGLS
jgi:hypothetical protein